MEKEIKKLESRQDVLDVWVSKGAKFENVKVHKIDYSSDRDGYTIRNKRGEYLCEVGIYALLYAPESNFFEVMFNLGEGFEEKELAKRTSYTTLADEVKKRCVTAPDPLARLLTELKETTIF